MTTKQDQYTVPQFITAIQKSGAVISVIAQRVGCDWHTAAKYINKYPKIAQAYKDEEERTNDLAVSVLVKAMQEGDVGVAKWWLERERKDTFAQRNEITGADGSPLATIIEVMVPSDEVTNG